MRIQAFFKLVIFVICLALPAISNAAPYAAMVMDARTGKVLHSRNADTRLHPASLTKMMTLYVVFSAVRNGEITMDTKVKISKNAAAEPPSKLGLRAGSSIQMRYLVRAAAVKSANDAATALGEAISGSESKFTARMNRTAKQLGMTRTTFKNAHGLTQSGHMSTARDMTILGKRLMYDFPEYYNLFSRQSTDAGLKRVNNTNRRLLSSYKGADGIKTGYTRAAGFNLVASAERGNKRVIATVFGGKSSASRNARVAELLSMGFGRLPNAYAQATPKPQPVGKKLASKTIKVPRAPSRSLFPRYRPDHVGSEILLASAEKEAIEAAVIAASHEASPADPVTNQFSRSVSQFDTQNKQVIAAILENQNGQLAPELQYTEAKVVTKSKDDPTTWGVQLGAYSSRFAAEKVLLRTVLADLNALDGALRKIVPATVEGQRLYRAQFVGISYNSALRACARLIARREECQAVPSDS